MNPAYIVPLILNNHPDLRDIFKENNILYWHYLWGTLVSRESGPYLTVDRWMETIIINNFCNEGNIELVFKIATFTYYKSKLGSVL